MKKSVVADRPARGTTWGEFCRAALALPGVVEGTSYRTPALHARKKLLARLKEDGETVAVRVELADRDFLLQADPEAFFLTDHYVGYPWLLVRLRRVRPGMRMDLFERAWQGTQRRRRSIARRR